MKSLPLKIIAKFTFVLLGLLLTIWWLLFFTSIDLPTYIPHTPININGLLIIASIITILISALKRILKTKAGATVFDLFISGALISILAEGIFQIIKGMILIKEENDVSLVGLSGVALIEIILSFLIAFQIKTKKTGMLILFIVTMIALINLITRFNLIKIDNS
ncbi:MAG TPA: hypothetical protein VIM55_20560 [Mucilaginibacter sp.]